MSADEYFVDTNIFVRFLVRDSQKTFEECSAFFESLVDGHFSVCTSSSVIAEIHWLLKSYYKLEKRDIVDFVARALSMPHLGIDNRDEPMHANTLFRDSSAKFIDALIASHPGIQDGSVAVVSYDRDFDKLGVRRLEPREVIKKTKRKG